MEQQQKKVSFTPFISWTGDYQQIKRSIIYDIDEIDDRVWDLPVHMKLLFSQAASLFLPNENMSLLDMIARVQIAVNNLGSVTEEDADAAYAIYRGQLVEAATDFLTMLGDLELRHGLNYILEKNKADTPFDLLKSVLDVPGYRVNSFGFPVTFQQRILAEFALERVAAHYDLTMLVVGKRGRGKSTFADETVSTFLELEGRPFGLENVMLTETKEQIFNMVKGWKPGEGYILDEAVNQLFSRDFFKGQDFISLLTEIRYKRTFSVFLIPELFQIDKIVRESLVDIVVQITERGVGVLMAPSLLSGEQRYIEEKPDSPVLTPESHTEYLAKKNMNTITVIPFHEIPRTNKFWVEYESLKDSRINAKKFAKPADTPKVLRANEYYYQFMVMVANTMPNATGIGEEMISDYSLKVSYHINAPGLARWLGRNLGVGWAQLLIDTPKGSIVDISNPLVKSYIKKLKALNDAIDNK